MIQLSHRVQQVKPSATLSITAKAAELRAAGKNIISLSVGEPEYDTPKAAREAGIQAINEGFTRYTAVAGIPELRQVIADKFSKDHQLDYEAKDILVSTGGKQCLYNLMQSVLNHGDEVLIPAPYWVSYPDMALLADAKPVCINTKAENDFKITATQLAAQLNERSRMLLLNSPSNPTGMVYSHTELMALGKVLEAYPKVLIACDDMYEKIIFDGKTFVTFAQANPQLKERTVTLNGVSKAYCMTGWRIGYAAGPRHIIQAMSKVQGQSTSNPNAIAQKAAIAALTGPTDEMQAMIAAYEQRRSWLVKRLNAIEGMQCLLPDGAFYVFPSIQAWLGKSTSQGQRLDTGVALCTWLLESAGVALVPGSAFGSEGYLRISYAIDQATLEDAINRLDTALQELH